VCVQSGLAADEAPTLGAYHVLVRELRNPRIQSFRTVYESAVHALRKLMSTTEPYVRPLRSRETHPFVQRDMPAVTRDKFGDGRVLDKEEFAARAVARDSPHAAIDEVVSAALSTDLKLAIGHVARAGSDIIKERRHRMRQLRTIAASLEPLRTVLDECKSKEASLIAERFNVAWAAALIDAMEWPDIRMPLLYTIGFPVVFDIPDSGVFRADAQPAEIAPAEFKAGNTRMVAQIFDEIRKSATQGSSEDRERRAQCWKRTREEIEEGLVFGPFTRAQADRWFGRGKWRCMGRNAIIQKGKWRCIDNGKRSKHNKACTLYERLTCGRADFPIMVGREFAKQWKHMDATRRQSAGVRKKRRMRRMRHGTNDLRAAYRKVPTSQPQYTLAACWDDDEDDVKLVAVPGHNFGLTSAVLNFNRGPEMSTVAARRLLWIINEHFYDDSDTCEPQSAGDSGQEYLVELSSDTFLGFPFDPGKDVPMDASNEYLGVESGFGRIHEGVLTMDVSTKRRDKLAALVDEVWKANELRSGLAASLFGKARFMLSPCYGCLGKACLQPIMAREKRSAAGEITPDIADALEFISFVCTHLPPLELPLFPSSDRRKVVIFTDAEGKQRKGNRPPTGHLGFVVYHPVHGKVHASAPVPRSVAELFDSFKKRDTYIAQYELLAALAVFLSLPRDWFEGRPIELWVDNSGALGALIKGYSGVPDIARIVNMFHFTVAQLGAESLWIDYVPSESNVADIPSRFHAMTDSEIEEVAHMLGTEVRMVIPELADDQGRWLSSTSIAQSLWGA
jgi:hypothetical protein